MDKFSQCSKLLRYMEEFGPITTWQAIVRLRIARPAARVADLKKRGYDIGTEIIYEDDGTHYAKYSLRGYPA